MSSKEPLLSTTSQVNKTFGFIDYFKPHLPDDITASAAFWMRTMESRRPGDRHVRNYNYDTVLCLVDARWIESEVWSMPLESSSTIHHTVSISDNQTMIYKTPQSKGGDGEEIIDLTLDYLDLLNASISTQLIPDVNKTEHDDALWKDQASYTKFLQLIQDNKSGS